MDEFTKLLVKSILARNALVEHECDRPWCAGIEPGCNDAYSLSRADGIAFQRALDAIVERGEEVGPLGRLKRGMATLRSL